MFHIPQFCVFLDLDQDRRLLYVLAVLCSGCHASMQVPMFLTGDPSHSFDDNASIFPPLKILAIIALRQPKFLSTQEQVSISISLLEIFHARGAVRTVM